MASSYTIFLWIEYKIALFFTLRSYKMFSVDSKYDFKRLERQKCWTNTPLCVFWNINVIRKEKKAETFWYYKVFSAASFKSVSIKINNQKDTDSENSLANTFGSSIKVVVN